MAFLILRENLLHHEATFEVLISVNLKNEGTATFFRVEEV
jgi:hypothetical protein